MATSGITSEHWNDANGNPEGGSTFGNGFAISWQHGPPTSLAATPSTTRPTRRASSTTSRPVAPPAPDTQSGGRPTDEIQATICLDCGHGHPSSGERGCSVTRADHQRCGCTYYRPQHVADREAAIRAESSAALQEARDQLRLSFQESVQYAEEARTLEVRAEAAESEAAGLRADVSRLTAFKAAALYRNRKLIEQRAVLREQVEGLRAALLAAATEAQNIAHSGFTAETWALIRANLSPWPAATRPVPHPVTLGPTDNEREEYVAGEDVTSLFEQLRPVPVEHQDTMLGWEMERDAKRASKRPGDGALPPDARTNGGQ